MNRYDMKKYRGEPRLYEKVLNHPDFREGEFWFVCDMCDLFAWTVPEDHIRRILEVLTKYPRTNFLLLTKNPERYKQVILAIPSNCVLGVTVETNGWIQNRGSIYDMGENWISEAPHPHERIDALYELKWEWEAPYKIMVSIEPIIDFDYNIFLAGFRMLQPDFVAVGYDNYNHKLLEPTLEKTERLISELEKFTTVYRKTIRKAWWET